MFVDGDHRGEAVKLDIESWYSKVRIGGIICGHDYKAVKQNLRTINEDFDYLEEKFPNLLIEEDIWWSYK